MLNLYNTLSHFIIMSASNTITELVPKVKESASVTLDSLFIEIETIKDTLASVSQHTEPVNFLWADSNISNGTIGLIAAIAGIIAAIFGFLGYKYQKISSEELKSMVPKRIPLLPFLKKLYDNYAIIRLVYDSSILLPSETKENDIDEDIADYEYQYLPWKSILTSAMLPESLLDISKYEKYDDNNIYISAVEMKLRWQEYNEYLQIAIDELDSGNINDKTCTKLIDLTSSISLYLMELDDMICKAEEIQYNVPYEKDKLCKDFKELIISHFIVWIGRHFYLNANLGYLYNVIADNDYIYCSFFDDYSTENDIYLSELLKRKDREPLSNVPLTIKTYLLRTNVNEMAENLRAIHIAFECENKANLSEEEENCVKFKQNLDSIYGASCAELLDKLYTNGSAKFNDIVGYDIFTKICDLKQEHLDQEQLTKEVARYKRTNRDGFVYSYLKDQFSEEEWKDITIKYRYE